MDNKMDEKATQGTSNAAKALDLETNVPDQTHAGNNPTGSSTAPFFSSGGSIGSQFKDDKGTLGGMAQKVGGPFDKEGMVGKQFTDQGAIGKTVENTLGKGSDVSGKQ
ncbi:MAG: hypothetical protein M1820_005127 [Bogoriella megaspora]|nr:MAG: hypothetical protein M1820_005127 [Bogoriella megaspora]